MHVFVPIVTESHKNFSGCSVPHGRTLGFFLSTNIIHTAGIARITSQIP
jgi:hypothetical protein